MVRRIGVPDASSGLPAMEPRTLLALCVLLPVIQGVLGEVWEFGVDAPGSIIVDHREDDFSLFQKNKEIKLKTPNCYVIEYVRVQVHNSISTPNVNFNKLTKAVTISYKPLQYSSSSFNIIAKAARKPGCFNQDMELQMRHKFGR